MASFVQDLWESIFTPGPTPTLLIATNVTFAVLQVVLAGLLIATYSVHFVVLSVLSGGLWAAINWFANELKVHQKQEEEKERRAQAAARQAVSSEDSETEVEGAAASSTSLKKEPPAPEVAVVATDVEAVKSTGELKHRVVSEEALSQGTKSSVSTEDEWERVSENEDGKSR
ncbi:ER protein Pkr1-domain-containing protein [Immersiella caudata]|uniref:ER protein Pkr1-domain-containing protein n=1 Tax=Immersiella caudata TaxID=314043 RepID=A0AA40CCL2_9PEZI|nr:ER protein Pkr1-domain-containing protein [Immersiella caudata]